MLNHCSKTFEKQSDQYKNLTSIGDKVFDKDLRLSFNTTAIIFDKLAKSFGAFGKHLKDILNCQY